MRTGSIQRQTTETKVQASLSLEGTGKTTVTTGIGFFDHMLTLWAKHGLFDLTLQADGDLYVDGHHTVEDTGIVIGQCVAQALQDKSGIRRYGTAFVPMDEALAMVAIDISGRPYLNYSVEMMPQRVGNFDSALVEEFFRAVSVHAGLTLHINLLAGKNAHHIIEAIFKACGRALAMAVERDPRITSVMSTKGML